MHLILAALSLGAAAIHLAAGPAHVEALGDLGLGFYWAALFQSAIAVGFLAAGPRGPGPLLSRVALTGSLVLTGMWVVSRTIGVPLVPGGAEPIGTADLVATVLQLGTIAAVWRTALGRVPGGGAIHAHPATVAVPMPRRAPSGRGMAAASIIAAIAVIALSSSIGVVDAASGHPHSESGGADTHAPGGAGHGHGSAASP